MDLLMSHKQLFLHDSEALSPIKTSGSSSHTSNTSFPVIAVAIIGILATCFLLVSYYIFVIKCCLNWHRIDLLRRFSFSTRQGDEDPLVVINSPMVVENRGLDEAAIRSIPVLEFKKVVKDEGSEKNPYECPVCLNEFQGDAKIRVLPFCGHFFHVDCVDVWLQNNANCPSCRTVVSATRPDIRFPWDQILAPISPCSSDYNFTGRDEDYVVIEIESRIPESLNSGEFLSISPLPRKVETPKNSRKRRKKFNRVSSMGDECIDNRQKDEQFEIEPIRRSFSMDSAADRKLYLAVQEIIQQNCKEVISEKYCSNTIVER